MGNIAQAPKRKGKVYFASRGIVPIEQTHTKQRADLRKYYQAGIKAAEQGKTIQENPTKQKNVLDVKTQAQREAWQLGFIARKFGWVGKDKKTV